MRDEQFRRLVENALDFLQRSIWDFGESPKYSVIHFYAAIELFLKARLLKEHWALVISKPETADLNKFLAGDFQSASMKEVADRLEKIVQSPLSSNERDQFQRLAKHRNKMVHFFHEVTNPSSLQKINREIAVEQLRAWFALSQLLQTKWSEFFQPWKLRLVEVGSELKKQKQYLQAYYEILKPELEKKISAGTVLDACSLCSLVAAEEIDNVGSVSAYTCHVCDCTYSVVSVECPDCGSKIQLLDGESFCSECKRKFEPNELAAILDEDIRGTKDYFEGGMPAHCGRCDSLDTVVHHGGGGRCVCSNCLQIFDEEQMAPCGYCGHVNAGLISDSLLYGCVGCDGKQGNWGD